MYAAQQSSIDPALAALMQTAQMVTPDNTPTVAAQVAEAAKQKMAPQGIAQGMPQAQQDFQAAMPSVMRNMQQEQMQKMVQQAMQPKPAGIEGLPAPNMQAMAEGGVVGFAGTDEFGSFVPDPVAMAVDELRVAEAKRRREDEERRRQLEFLEGAGAPQAAQFREPVRATQPAAQPAAQPAPQPQPQTKSQSQPRPQAAPQAAQPAAGIEQLMRPQFRGEGIATAGKEFTTDAEQRIARMQAIEDQRAAAKKAMPDLNAQGIAALQRAEEERQRLLKREQSDDERRRWAGVFRGWGGDRDAYDKIVGGINQRDALANQAQVGFEQAKIKLQQAQQAEALGQFDRKLAFEKEAAELANKARDDMLKARQIESGIATSRYSAEANMYGTDVSARERGLDRVQQAKIEGAKLQQQAVQNNQMQLANRINAANITVNSAIEKMEKTLANKYGAMINIINTMTPEMLQKQPKMAATYEAYLKDKETLYKQTVEPAVMERTRLAAQVGGGNITRYDAQGNPVR
jgi:hypothetical protein